MKAILSFAIECGEKTCAKEPGLFCPFLKIGTDLSQRTSVKPAGICHLFGSVFENEEGWIQRHPECLKSAEPILHT